MQEEPVVKTRTVKPKLDPDRFRMSEITAAVAHLYNMQDPDFQLDTVSRVKMAGMLGVARSTVFRCIRDARNSVDLAIEIKRRMKELAIQEEREKEGRREERNERMRQSRERRNAARRKRRQRLREKGLLTTEINRELNPPKPLPIKQVRRRPVSDLFQKE